MIIKTENERYILRLIENEETKEYILLYDSTNKEVLRAPTIKGMVKELRILAKNLMKYGKGF